MGVIRLLVDPPLSGPTNMARDEALLQHRPTEDQGIILRLYAWSPATISLGYFQTYQEFEALGDPAGSLSVVRRTTGGGAILHDDELTYSIVIHGSHPLVRRHPNRLYERAHKAIIATIGHGVRMLGSDHESCDASTQRGPFFCFARRHGLDVVVKDDAAPLGLSKIAGSAQRRTRDAILQHGSIMLGSRFSQQSVATWNELAGPVDFGEAARRFARAMETELGIPLAPSGWNAQELDSATRLLNRYAGDAWTRDRQR